MEYNYPVKMDKKNPYFEENYQLKQYFLKKSYNILVNLK